MKKLPYERSLSQFVGSRELKRLILSGIWAIVPASVAFAQSPAESGVAAVADADPPSKLDPATDEAIQLSIETLGSDAFAARERAAEELMTIGIKAVPALRQLSNHQDPEVRLRATDLVRQLAEGDFQKRVEAFLAGKDVHFDGWDFFQSKLGSSPAMREMFVELTKSYPELVEALERTSRDRAVVQESTIKRIQASMFIERRWPDPVDAIALLLPVADPDVPISPAFENLLIGLLRGEVGSRIHREQQLSAPVSALIGDWVQRSSVNNRGEVLWFSMNWGVPESLQLAIRTLDEQHRTDILATAMQVIARFGSKDDAKLVAKFLDDNRPASEMGIVIGAQSPTLISDVAMATIAVLHDVPLSDLGWVGVSKHPVISFSVEELGFPANTPELREKARAKVDALLVDAVPKS